MKNRFAYILLFLSFVSVSCRKDKAVVPEPGETLKITSQEFHDKLLFVTKNNFQIQTSEPATFTSTDSKIKINSSGLVERLTSGEVALITATSVADSKKVLKIYAVGATDNQHDEPYSKYHDYANSSTNPYSDYKKGWETLQKMPVANETYAFILRHGDADVGKDDNETEVENWWKSSSSTLARQLNQQGKDRSTELGKIFKDLQFPIARLISSEFRRATETAELLNTGLTYTTDGRLNHPSYNKSGLGLFTGMTQVVKEQTVDNKITLITAHHPMNELKNVVDTNFPKVMAFTWTGGFFVKVAADKTLSYQGSVSYAMMKYFRDLKLGKL